MGSRIKKAPPDFAQLPQIDVPQGRNGKHKPTVTRILADLDRLEPGTAIKVPLAGLADTKENVRSALNRPTQVWTSSTGVRRAASGCARKSAYSPH